MVEKGLCVLRNTQKILEAFESYNFEDKCFFSLENEEKVNINIYYDKTKKKSVNKGKYWSVWIHRKERTSKKIISSDKILLTLEKFKINENDFCNYLSYHLLVQVAFADEFIRQMTELFGPEPIQKSILETQNFMVNLEESIKNLLDEKQEPKNKQQAKNKFTVVK